MGFFEGKKSLVAYSNDNHAYIIRDLDNIRAKQLNSIYRHLCAILGQRGALNKSIRMKLMRWLNRRVAENIIILFVSFGVSLLLIELMVRIFFPQRIETPQNFYSSDPLLGWKLKPYLRQSFSSPDFLIELIVNGKGFRAPEHNYEKPQDTFRIVGIGDSMLFGFGVNYEDTVLFSLERLLYDNNPSAERIEAINLGIPGYNINQYYKILKTEGYRYRPDLVIMFFYQNDWRQDDNYDYAGVDKKGFRGLLVTSDNHFSFKSIRSFLFPLRSFLKNHSQAYMLARDRIKGLLMKIRLMDIPAVAHYKKDKDFAKRFFHTLDLMNEMNAFCRNQLACPFLVCIIPEKMQVRMAFLNMLISAYKIDADAYDWLQPQLVLTKFCLTHNIHYLDLTDTFKKAEQKKPMYFNIDCHWNKEGHLLAAQIIYEFIKENKMKEAP